MIGMILSLSSDCTWRTVSMANLERLKRAICITNPDIESFVLYMPMDRFLLPLALNSAEVKRAGRGKQ